MNNTVTLPEIAEALAAAAGTDRDTATRFVVQLFSAVETQLAATRKVNLPGIGTFSNTREGLVFVPEKQLASAINAPFSIFAPVEITAEDALRFEAAEEETAAEQQAVQAAQTHEAETVPPAFVHEPAQENDHEPEPEPESEPAPELVLDEAGPECESTQPQSEVHHENGEEPEPTSAATQPEPQIIYVARRNPWPWVAALIALVAGFAGGYCLGHYSSNQAASVAEPVETTEFIAPKPADSADEAEEAPAPAACNDTVVVIEKPEISEDFKKEPVYDSVGTSRYLTTIARDHYGRKDFWVFIYEANASHLKSPNLISPGTRVVIPDLGEHPALNPELRARARRLAAEYTERYNL